MALMRFEPFRDLLQLQEQMHHAFNQRAREEALSTAYFPAVDVFEDQDGVALAVEIPGVEAKDVDLRIENNLLTVSGERKLEREDKKEHYLRVERSYGQFSRTFTLPPTVNTEKVKAEFKNGVLKVFLPRKEETRPRQIKVNVES